MSISKFPVLSHRLAPIALLVALFLSPVAFGQHATTDLRFDQLKGSVQKVVSKTYEAIDNGTGTLQRGDIMENTVTTYNEQGQRRSTEFISTEEDVMFKTRYRHDGFGVTTMELVVDQEGNELGRTYYIYDEGFNLTETYVEDAERQIESRVLYRYDDHHRISQRSYNDPLGNIYRREVYSYSLEDVLLKTVVFDRKGKKMQELRYEYDAHGNVVSQTVYDYSEEEPEMTITLFRYSYDAAGNWIQKADFTLVNDKLYPQSLIERSITYFQ